MSGLDNSTNQPTLCEEPGESTVDQKHEGFSITDSSESSQTPSTPRFFYLADVHYHYLSFFVFTSRLFDLQCHKRRLCEVLLIELLPGKLSISYRRPTQMFLF